jgi:hypothetical protein
MSLLMRAGPLLWENSRALIQTPRSISLIKRSDISVSTDDLVEHPHLSGLLTLPMVYPNNTITKYDEEPKQKPYLWWVIGGIWKSAETDSHSGSHQRL